MLQLYRLYVVQAEAREAKRLKMRKSTAPQTYKQQRRHQSHSRHQLRDSDELNDIYTIAKGRSERPKKR